MIYKKILEEIEEICHQIDEDSLSDKEGINKIFEIMSNWRNELIQNAIIKDRKEEKRIEHP